ncbi:MAG: VOC family protein [Rhodobacteraceae bacterium]|nr:VOC family protein [Paracoccaceae bacterium]
MRIDYIELPSRDVAATSAFFASAFGWGTVDYGPDYRGLAEAGIDGGIDGTADRAAAPLVILKAEDLAAAEARVRAAGGTVTRPAFAFPGGRRFHFREPGGTEMAVWSET